MTARVDVSGVADGRVVVRFCLAHGEDPAAGLRSRGWRLLRSLEASREPDPWRVELTFAVARTSGEVTAAAHPVPRDPGLSDADVAGAVLHQRVAAYALVTSGRGLLLTELAETTNAAGQWTLPGGGLEPGEAVEAGLRREIHEETGQEVGAIDFLGVRTGHWVGRAPGGDVEDYHAVRLVHRAVCHAPTDPVVHDIGGSTSAAAWLPRAALGGVPVVVSFADLVAGYADGRPVTDVHVEGRAGRGR